MRMALVPQQPLHPIGQDSLVAAFGQFPIHTARRQQPVNSGVQTQQQSLTRLSGLWLHLAVQSGAAAQLAKGWI